MLDKLYLGVILVAWHEDYDKEEKCLIIQEDNLHY